MNDISQGKDRIFIQKARVKQITGRLFYINPTKKGAPYKAVIDKKGSFPTKIPDSKSNIQHIKNTTHNRE